MLSKILGPPSSVTLAETSNVLRIPPRPQPARQETYLSQFDARTIVYDVFAIPELSAVIAVVPPPLNLLPYLQESRFEIDGVACAAQIRFYDRIAEIWMSWPRANPTSFQLGMRSGRVNVAIGEDFENIFKDRRVLLTMQKDNNPDWIVDWINFYVKIHRCDSVLIFDNNSSLYSISQLERHIRENTNLERLALAPWPFPFGPDGGPHRIWDSDFCQFGALAEARLRFLRSAKSVLQCDIDELVICANGASIFEVTEQSSAGYSQFWGRWISSASENITAQNFASRRHKDYRFGERNASACTPKWACVPRKLPIDCQWLIHSIGPYRHPPPEFKSVLFRHFRGINNNWLYRRAEVKAPNHVTDEVDHDLALAYERMNWRNS